MKVLRGAYVFLAWAGWAVIALVATLAWTAFSVAPVLAFEGPLYRAAEWLGLASATGSSPLLAWLTLPLVTGAWLYLLLWLTRRTVMFNDAIYWLNVVLLVVMVLLAAFVWLGVGKPSGGYVLFGYDASDHGIVVWSLWTATAAASMSAALYVFRRRNRSLREQVRRSASGNLAIHA